MPPDEQDDATIKAEWEDYKKGLRAKYRSLQDMDAQMRTLRSQLRDIGQLPNPSDDDLVWQGTIIKEHDALDEIAEPHRKRAADLERISKRAQDPENREEPQSKIPSMRGSNGPDLVVRDNRDPLEDMGRVRSNLVGPKELSARALNLIEADNKRSRWQLPDEKAEAASRRAEEDPRIARHMLLTGGEEYRDAFRAYLQDPLGEDNRMRAINLTNASGGYLLPYVLDPTIVLTNNASANPFRRISRVVQTTSSAWQGVNSAGVNAALVAETATAADGAPTDFAQIQVAPKKFAAWVLATYEAADDTNFGEQLPGLFGDAKDRIESAYFATGSGTNAPLGAEAALAAGSRVAPTTTGTAFNGTGAIPDVYNLQAALPPRFRQSTKAAFVGNLVTLNKVRALDLYGGGSFWANLTSDTPASLLGQPVYEASDLNATMTGTSAASGTASTTLMFADWNQFIIADRVGVSMLYDPMIKGTGANAQLPAGEAGWYMFWRTGSTTGTTAGFRYLTIS
jgi:HK97 family phage major capsid protein